VKLAALLLVAVAGCARVPPDGFVVLRGFPAVWIQLDPCTEMAPADEWSATANVFVHEWQTWFADEIVLRDVIISCEYMDDDGITGYHDGYGGVHVMVDRLNGSWRRGVFDTAFSHELIHVFIGDANHEKPPGRWTQRHHDLAAHVDAVAEAM
jgi:hypothetical protein